MTDAFSEPDPLAWLLEVSHTLPPIALGDAIAEALERAGALSSDLYLVDHDQLSLHPFPSGPDPARSIDVDGTIGGRAFTLETTVTVAAGSATRLWIPLVDGTSRVGVLSVDLDADLASDERVTGPIELVAALAAELVISKARYTDAIEWTRRRQPMSLEAELQRCTLPPVTLVTPSVSVAGMLLPAYEVAGDSFDYSLNDDTLEVAVIDSVGHDARSSVISHLVYGSLRNSRRNRLDLPAAYHAADTAVATVFPDITFATAAFGRLDVSTGRFRWISAGHPPPLVVRNDKVLATPPTVPVLPIGLGGVDPAVNEVVLEPGDKLLLYTDGVIEGGVRRSEPFGLDRLVDLLGRTLLDRVPPAETLRRLVNAVLRHSAYRLRDDTTMVLVCLHELQAT
jgi:serine phosphatase RsbU (regulator of sigma subunit)